MAVTLYKSTDTSAPTLTGQAGSLVTVLDAILVNGYGSQTAAGWTIAYTGTNKRDYRMATSGNTGFYLDVDDSAPTTAKEARMRGYEVMTALGTGTNAFPTSAQSSFGVVCRKSTTADATARPWYCIADGSVLYFFTDTGDYTGPSYSFTFSFGDFFSYKSGDAYNCQISGRRAENSTGDTDDMFGMVFGGTTMFNYTSLVGSYVARVWTGTGGSLPNVRFTGLPGFAGTGSSTIAWCPMGGQNALIPYPNGPDGGLELAPVWIAHSNAVRGYYKGIWAPQHNQPCGHGDTFSGTGNMAGKSFIALNIKSQSNNASAGTLTSGQMVIETSNTWS